MSVSRPGSMRGPQLKTPFLVLLLVLLSTLTGTVLCQNEDDGSDQTETETEGTETEGTGDADPVGDEDTQTSEPPPGDPDATSEPDPSPADEDLLGENTDEGENGSGENYIFTRNNEIQEEPEIIDPTAIPQEEEGLSPLIILIPVVLVVVIISIIVCGICINRRWNKQARNQELRKEDPYLDGSPTEKVPMPMFEEDVPSVLELEMEELDRWMKHDSEAADESTPT